MNSHVKARAVGDIVGFPNPKYIGIVTEVLTHNRAHCLIYLRDGDYAATTQMQSSIAYDFLDLKDPPAVLPDHIYKTAMKVRLLT